MNAVERVIPTVKKGHMVTGFVSIRQSIPAHVNVLALREQLLLSSFLSNVGLLAKVTKFHRNTVGRTGMCAVASNESHSRTNCMD